MPTDTELIELITTAMRAEVEGIDPPPTLVHQSARRPGLRLHLPGAGNVIVALASLAAVALAVGALLLAGHGGSRPAPAAPVPAGARALVAKLAVLRRPQTAADRTLPAGMHNPSLIGSLTRLAVTIPDPAGGEVRVFVTVRGLTASRQAVLSVLAVHAPRNRRRGRRRPVSIVRWGSYASSTAWRSASSRTASRACTGRSAARISPRRSPRTSPGRGPGNRRASWRVASVTWFASDGKVLATNNGLLDAERRQRADLRAIAASDKRPIAPSLLEHFALFRSPKTAAESLPMPEGIAAGYARQGGGLNVGAARFVPVPETEPPASGFPHGVWVIPGTTGLCDMDTQMAGTCADLGKRETPLNGGFLTTSTGNGTEWVTGVVPDGNRTVFMWLSDGSQITVPVIHNVYSVALKGTRAMAMKLRTAAGTSIEFTLG